MDDKHPGTPVTDEQIAEAQSLSPNRLKSIGVSRDGPNGAVTVTFSRALTDEELMFFEDVCGRSAPLMDMSGA